MQGFSIYAIPVILLVVLTLAMIKKIKVYEIFVDGAKEGFQVAVRIIPYLVAILVAIGMFRASGAMGYLVKFLSPVTSLIGMPAEALPVALMRPLSGSGTLGIVTELMKEHGPDSFIGRLTSTMFGSTETTFYVLAVYFGSVGIKKTRHAVAAGLIGDVAGMLAAVMICHIVFG
ncbi:MAG: spore maturation protein [Candidatus Marinimicrobia bacterium]|nr:spore maturation protein [Candidatus Neomarinimicrobiota bacterium]